MSNKYEWEEAVDDDSAAKVGAGALIIGGLGLAAKLFSDHSKNKKKQEIEELINRKTDQYRQIDAKWFKSAAEKNEINRLKKEISKLKSQL